MRSAGELYALGSLLLDLGQQLLVLAALGQTERCLPPSVMSLQMSRNVGGDLSKLSPISCHSHRRLPLR